MGSQSHREHKQKSRTPRFQKQWVTKAIDNTTTMINKNKISGIINLAGRLQHFRKYGNIRDTININKYITHIAGYSLGAAVADQFANELSQIKQVRLYSSPTIRVNNHHENIYFTIRSKSVLISSIPLCKTANLYFPSHGVNQIGILDGFGYPLVLKSWCSFFLEFSMVLAIH